MDMVGVMDLILIFITAATTILMVVMATHQIGTTTMNTRIVIAVMETLHTGLAIKHTSTGIQQTRLLTAYF